jgi:hypothetical protein
VPPSSDVPTTAPPSPPPALVTDEVGPPASTNGATPAVDAVAIPVTGTGERTRRRRRRRLGRIAFWTSLLALLCSIPALGYTGYRAVFNSTSGRKINLPTDPSKEGFEANVTPTTTALLLATDASGALSGAAVASLVTDAGGAVTGGNLLLLPVGALSPAAPAASPETLARAWSVGGREAVVHAATVLFGLAYDDVVVIDHARWADLVAPVAPITVDNPDRITEVASNGKTKTVFAAGQLQLQPDEVGTYFEVRSPSESELGRLARQQLLWDAWLAAVRSAPDPAAAVPGETGSGIGRYLQAFDTGTFAIFQLPIVPSTAVDAAGTDKEAFTIDGPASARLIATIAPYPTGGPDGGRVRVRILDGVRQPGLTLLVAPLLVPEGAEIAIAGNADRFTYDTTQIVYYDEAFKDAADRFRQALGAGQVVQSSVLNDSNDVTVVVGRDFVDNGAATTVTTGGSGG